MAATTGTNRRRVSLLRRSYPRAYDDNDDDEAALLLDENDAGAPLDEEMTQEKLKYPRSVFFIISNEFCERFSFYGMRTILAIFLKTVLKYTDDTATIIYHVFAMFCYFFPIFGAMLADSLLGKFRTIFYLSIVYAIGNVVISLGSAESALGLPGREVSIIGLLLISIGTGGIKPCVSAFGGDQFILPQQERQLAQFFSLFYFSINSGSLVSTFLTPVLREDVKCLGENSCYPLAFGVPAALMVVSIMIFVAGKSMYVMKQPQGNVVLNVCKCMWHALSRKRKLKGEKRDHWLDYADDKHDKKMINDVKAALKVLFLYLPLPIFWALFDQQGSRWTFQATRMKGDLGDYTLKPDQMQVINPLLILIFIPIFETGIYPLLEKCNLLKSPLQRLGVGGVLAAISFIVSAVVELQLEPTYAVLPQAGEAQIRVFNSFDCKMNVSNSFNNEQFIINSLDVWETKHFSVEGEKSFELYGTVECATELTFSGTVTAFEGEATSYLIIKGNDNHTSSIYDEPFRKDDIDKSDDGGPKIRVIYHFLNDDKEKIIVFSGEDDSLSFTVNTTTGSTKSETTEVAEYTVKIDDVEFTKVNLELGGVYTLLVQETEANKYDSKLFTITDPNSVHMLWLIPQYVIMTMGEVMFSITGLEFSFTQAPISMKSVMQAGWLLTIAFGNLIVVIVAEAKFFDSQANEFFLFAGLMIVDIIIFSLMAARYKYVDLSTDDLALEPTNEKSGVNNKGFKEDDEQ